MEELIDKERNPKIKKAMQLFSRSDDMFRRVFFHATGFRQEPTPENIREHFDTLDLMDQIDDVIWNFEDELENA